MHAKKEIKSKHKKERKTIKYHLLGASSKDLEIETKKTLKKKKREKKFKSIKNNYFHHFLMLFQLNIHIISTIAVPLYAIVNKSESPFKLKVCFQLNRLHDTQKPLSITLFLFNLLLDILFIYFFATTL